jgi:hypothetical protein
MNIQSNQGFNYTLGFGLRKFRAFQDSGTFPLAPLTCIVGANSSGKSSIITALLLLKQSLEQDVVSSRGSPLTLNGAYCELGSFSDVVFRHNERAQIGLVFEIPLAAILDEPYSRVPIVSLAIPRSPLMRRPSIYYQHYSRERSVKLPANGYIKVELSFATDEPFGPSISELKVTIDNVDGVRFVRTIKGKRKQHWRTYAFGIPSKSLELRFVRSVFFPIIAVRDSEYNKAGPHYKRRITQAEMICRYVFRYIDRVLADS